MADPVTLGATAIGASAGGGILEAMGKLFTGSATSKSYEYQAAIAAMNSKIKRQDAAYQRQVGEVEAQQVGLKGRAEIGQAKVAQGARGFDVAGGSNAAVRSSMQDITTQNERITRSNAARRAYGAEVEKANFDAQTAAYSTAASTTRTASFIGAGSSILGGASSVSSKWLQGQQIGLWG